MGIITAENKSDLDQLASVLKKKSDQEPQCFSCNLYFNSNQGSHRLEKFLNLESFLIKALRIKYASKSTGKSLKGLEKFFNSSIFCRI